ncbi:hypothetical protein [Aeromicrobium sp. CF3.5]|uniref:hypothetical protein n=1 Tax=Aeromicrobium sp. CF3.5 TaxID=3373078 RepID=UPI003EE63564
MSTESTPARNVTGSGTGPKPATDWTDLGREMWEYLTGRGAAVSYQLVDMEVEVPRDTGPHAARATWKFNGTIRVVTSDDEFSGAEKRQD